ncbi:PH domain-containing protein [Allokutzneria sp. A3M-2-11 16]|uniref:PH domain-containing protein n=1 Tax=Allokutzneria sp. A3M-2-11 16 TaxID=2962043 RepID=UPI0020B8F464|nr:PH domain-containing protein [Allokutzneria sp. A3M-2-11 16]MCP3799521.1 PH domain-containing protein [Allokutzneria sp. A3M-2-11 16]
MNDGSPAGARCWSPPAAVVGGGWLLAAGALTWVFLARDTPTQVFATVAAVLLGFAALYGTVARPRLTADAGGITVRGLTGTRSWSWAELTPRLHSARRFGRTNAVLEIDVLARDGAETLLVFTRLDLGADPVDVAAVLTGLAAQ